MALNGYYVKKNFFSGMPDKEKVTFYLTDGNFQSGNVCRIKDIYISIDLDTYSSVVVVDNAYGKSPFIAELDLTNPNDRKRLFKFTDEVKEWLGLRNTWRKIRSAGKSVRFILISENTCEIKVFEGKEEL